MTQQVWDFASIHAAIGTLRGHAAAIQGLNEEVQGALAQGVGIWQGEASDMWANEQQTLNHHFEDFRTALESYFASVEDATHNTASQEMINASSFGG
jgi:WXG100 family type VII secretion target